MQDDNQNVLTIVDLDLDQVVDLGEDEESDNDKKKKHTSDDDSDDEESDELIFVPNPREWDEKNIETWVSWISKKFRCDPKLEPGRFPTDSQELLKFTKADFWVCGGSGANGNYLAKHFGYLLKNATGSAHESLLNDTEPGNFILSLLIFQFHFCFFIFLSIGK